MAERRAKAMRRLPRSFFWIDQGVIRSGAWQKLSAEARLAYVALAASCDREGISIGSAPKLMQLSASRERENWDARVLELESPELIERVTEHCLPAIRLKEFETPLGNSTAAAPKPKPISVSSPTSSAPIVVHTQTTIHIGGAPTHVDPRNPD
jgi:hypothetical protein